MEKKLHTSLPLNPPSHTQPSPHQTIQQSLMEEEFSAEIALLQGLRLMPRPEAVAQLLDRIDRQSVAEQH